MDGESTEIESQCEHEGCVFAPRYVAIYEHYSKHYCVHHLPVSPEKKIDIVSHGDLEYAKQALNDYIRQRSSVSALVDLTHVHFMDDPFAALNTFKALQIDLSESTTYVTSSTDGLGTIVKQFKAKGAKFKSDLEIGPNTTFEEGIDISRIEVAGDLKITATIHSALMCSNIVCKKNAEISIASSPTPIKYDFSGIRVDGGLTVSRPNASHIDLRGCRIDGEVSILGSGKLSEIDISRAMFGSTVSVEGNKALIEGIWSTKDTGGTCIATDLVLSGSFKEIRLHGAIVENVVAKNLNVDVASFHGVEVNQTANLSSASLRSAEFSHCDFKSAFNAANARVGDWHVADTDFSAVSFISAKGGVLRFIDCDVSSALDVSADSQSEGIYISDFSFLGGKIKYFSAANRVFSDHFDMSTAVFTTTPNFINCKFTGSVELSRDIDSYACGGELSATSYRELKKAMEEKRNRQAQSLFQALELRSQRLRSSTYGLTRFLSYLYDVFGRYGYAIGLPLRWLVGLNVLLFLPIYWIANSESIFVWSMEIDWRALNVSALETLRQITAPAYDVRTAEKFEWILLLKLFQSVLSITLITISILAIRWRFRRS